MFNLGDDNELDHVSREAAGKFTPPGEANWQALSKELDRVMPVEKRKRRIIFWWLLPVLLTGGAATYWLVNKDDTATVSTISKETAGTEAGKKETKTITPATVPAEVAKEDNVTANTNEKPATTNPAVPRANKTAASAAGTPTVKNNRMAASGPRQTKNSLLTGKSSTESRQSISKPADQPAQEAQQQVSLVAVQKKEADAATGTTATNTNPAANEQLKTAVTKENQPNPAAITEPQNIPSATVEPNEKNKETPFTKRGKGWSFGLLAGVDKSTVKFKFSGDAGINIGLIAGYHFNDRLSVHTGAIYTQKNYKVAGPDFTAPKGSWVSYYKIDNVEGYCRMIEVPLMARYTLSESAKKSFFVSTGLSSYFMSRENYDYTYYTTVGGLATRNNAYNSTDTHILSILHLSAGFENKFGRNFSLLVEPYAKVPLGGVGFGNIHLSSFGLNFSVQHRQPSKK